MKGRALALLIPLALAASGGMWYFSTSFDPPGLTCPAIASGEALAAARGAILIDGAPSQAAQAAQAIGCAAAVQGATLDFFAAPRAGEALAPLVSVLERAGVRTTLRVLDAPAATGEGYAAEQAAGETRSESFAATVAAGAPDALRPDVLRIVALTTPDAARALVGVAGHTWRPLGARLPDAETISLRAEGSATPGIRLKLRPFEDVPLHGAVMRYDGLIEVGPDAAATQLRGR